MQIKKTVLEKRMVLNVTNIPLDSNLGLLAYGDIAFEAWRKLKTNAKTNEVNDPE